MLWNEARSRRTSSGIKDWMRGKWANGSVSGVCTSSRSGCTTASRPMGRKSLPLGDVGEWHLKITRGPSFDGEGRGDGHTARPTCKASSSSRLRRGLRGGNGLCGGLVTSVAMGPFVPVSALSVLWLSLFLDRLRPSDRAGPRSRSSGVPLRWWLPRSRAPVSLRGLPGWHSQALRSTMS